MRADICAIGCLVATACAGAEGPDRETGTPLGSDTSEPGALGSGLGDIVVEMNADSVVGDAETRVIGVFTDPPTDVTNLAQCLAGQQFCLREELPREVGASVDAEPFDTAILTTLDTVSAGPSITLGDWSAPVVFDSTTDLRFYTQITPGTVTSEPPLDLEVPGDAWPATTAEGIVEMPDPIGLRLLDPTIEQEFVDVDGIPLRWVPGDDGGAPPFADDEGSGTLGAPGEVFLYIETPGRRRLQRLADTGSFDLDLSGANLADGDEVELVLGRWTRGEVVDGARRTVVTLQRNQRIRGVWRSVGVRRRLVLADTCEEVETLAGLDDGFYEGRFDPETNVLDPGPGGCTGRAAGGPEGLVPVDVRPQHELSVRFALPDAEASLYLLTDCDDVGTCLVGSDRLGPETLAWVNESESLVRVFVALDVVGEPEGDFTLDVRRRALGGDVLVNTCIDAIEQGPIGPGFFEGSLLDHSNLLVSYPEDGPCGGVRDAGEGIAAVQLGGGQTIAIDAQGSTPGTGIHLLANCSIAASCVAFGADTLTWTNPTPFERTVYIVLDAEVGIDQYRLGVTF